MRPRIVLFDSNVAYAGFPLALLSITTLLDRSRFDIRIITTNEFPDWETAVMDACDGALCLGISSMIGPPVGHALSISRKVKARYPELPIVWGGWLSTTLPELCLDMPCVDFVCMGQGERTFAELVEALQCGDRSRVRSIEGLGGRTDGATWLNPRREPEDINHFQDPDLHLINLEKHLQVSSYGTRGLALHTSFGCPWRCGFCCEQHYCGRHWYGLTAERVIGFIQQARECAHIDHYLLHDTNFFVSEKRVRAICEALIANKLTLPSIGANGRSNELARYDESTWKLMAEAGIKSVLLGIESVNDRTLRAIDKDTTVANNIDVIRKCARFGIRSSLSFALGWEAEMYIQKGADAAFDEEFNELLQFIRHLYFHVTTNFNVFIYLYQPLPCTSMYESAKRHGFQAPQSLEGWAKFDTHDAGAPWVRFGRTNRERLHTLREVVHKLGQDYPAYIRHLPRPYRIVAGPLVYGILAAAEFRLRHGLMRFPVEFRLFSQCEEAFRSHNRKKGLIHLHDR